MIYSLYPLFSPQVNDVQVQGLSHQDASSILRKAEGTAKLVLGRPRDSSGFDSLRLPGTVEAQQKNVLRRMKTVEQEQMITLNKVCYFYFRLVTQPP